MDRNSVVTHSAKYAAALSLTEAGLGSFLHGFHIPFRGQFLSLNQAAVLSRASVTGTNDRREAIQITHLISFSAACVKSLSPMGRRLTPMLGISVQGLLFSFGQWIGGVTRFGHALGGVLVAIWAMAQPFLLAWLFNGKDFFRAIDWAIRSVSPFSSQTTYLLFGCTVLGVLGLSVGVMILTFRLSETRWHAIQERLSHINLIKERKETKRRFRVPVFLVFSVLLTSCFLFFTESEHARSIWMMLRPVGVLIVLYFGTALLPLEKVIAWQKKRSPAFGEVLEQVFVKLGGRV